MGGLVNTASALGFVVPPIFLPGRVLRPGFVGVPAHMSPLNEIPLNF